MYSRGHCCTARGFPACPPKDSGTRREALGQWLAETTFGECTGARVGVGEASRQSSLPSSLCFELISSRGVWLRGIQESTWEAQTLLCDLDLEKSLPWSGPQFLSLLYSCLKKQMSYGR